nr:acyl coenzyme A synthetase family [Hymenolepis microstoma]
MDFQLTCKLHSHISNQWSAGDVVAEVWTNESDSLTVHREYSLLYSEFSSLSNELDHLLRPVSPTLVGILWNPNVYTLIAVHGTLLSNSAFLPLSNNDQLAEFFDLFGAVLCLFDEPKVFGKDFTCVQASPFKVYVRIDGKSHPLPSECDLAYCITTSGSTGPPKLVLASHSCVSANVLDLVSHLPIVDGRKKIPGVFITSPLTFDASIVQIYVALATHRHVVFPSSSILFGVDGNLLEQILLSSNVDTWQCTPSVFSRLPPPSSFSNLKTLSIFLGGEPCSPDRLPSWALEKWHIFFLYGLTEVSAWSSIVNAKEILSEKPPISGATPIGSPMLKSQVIIKDINEETNIGQIYVGRSGGGYAIVEKPFTISGILFALKGLQEERLIPTGDYGISVLSSKHSPLWFVGRKDRLVKIHGWKYYLECLETEILQLLGTRYRVINCRCEAPPLSAYIQLQDHLQSNELSDLKQWLMERIGFPISHNNVILSDKPLHLNANGKVVDRSIKRTCLSSILSTNIDISNLTFQQLGGTSLKAMYLIETLIDNYPVLISKKAMLLSTLFSRPFSEFIRSTETAASEIAINMPASEKTEIEVKRRKVDTNCKAELVWSVVLGKCVDASPIMDSKSVFIGSHSGAFKRLDIDTGAEFWSRNIGSRIEATACLIDSLIVFGSLDGQLYALHVEDGEIAWIVDVGGAVKSAPARVPNTPKLLIGSHGRRLLAIGKSGCVKWSENLDESPIVAPVTLDENDEFAFVGTLGGGLHRVDVNIGHKDWSVDNLGPIFGAPRLLADLNQIVLASADGNVHGLLKSNGVRLWSVTLNPRGGFFSPPVLLNLDKRSLLLLANQSGHLHALEPASGKAIWTLDCGTTMLDSSSRTVFPIAPQVVQQSDSIIFARTDGCIFHCENLEDNPPSPQLIYRLPSETFSTTLIRQFKPGVLSLFIGCRNDTINRIDFDLNKSTV